MDDGSTAQENREPGEDWQKVISFKELRKGLRKAKRGVMWKNSTVKYSQHGLIRTLELAEDLERGAYQIQSYQVFTIHEPKEREIVATRIRDRQFQRSLCDNALYRDMTRGLIYDNCACLIGKGVDFAMNRMETHLHRYYREHGADGWVLRCDIRHFFPETSHEIAKAALRKRIRDPDVLKAAETIVDSFEGEKGIGLGSQVSQLIELAVLDPIDHWIKERQGIRRYVRYMDDFILISHDREKLRETMRGIRERVEALGLSLNGKTQIYPLRQGIRFLQWRYVLTDTGKVIRKMSRRSQTREQRKLKRIAEKIRAGQMEERDLHESFQSWRAHAMRGNSHKAIRRMTRLYDQLKGEIEMEKNILVSLEERMTRATARMEAAADRLEKLAAEQDYIAMMADVDIPTEDETEDMEGMENE